MSEISGMASNLLGDTHIDDACLGNRKRVEPKPSFCTYNRLPGRDLFPDWLEYSADAVWGKGMRVAEGHDSTLHRNYQTKVKERNKRDRT